MYRSDVLVLSVKELYNFRDDYIFFGEMEIDMHFLLFHMKFESSVVEGLVFPLYIKSIVADALTTIIFSSSSQYFKLISLLKLYFICKTELNLTRMWHEIVF